MNTLITIWDYSNNYAIIIKDNFPLVINLLNNSYLYTINSNYSRFILNKSDIKNSILSIINFIKINKRVEQVNIKNDIEFVTFENPIIYSNSFNDELCINILGDKIYMGKVHNAKSRRYYQ